MNAETVTLIKTLLEQHSVEDTHALMQCTVTTRTISMKQVRRVKSALDSPSTPAERAKLYSCLKPDACTVKKPGGFCSSCRMKALRADPDHEVKRIAKFRTRFEDPEFRAKYTGASAQRLAAWRACEENKGYLHPNSRANLAMAHTPEFTEKRVRAVRVAFMGWCPEERWAEYRKLARSVGAPEARRMILADIAAKERDRLAKLSPFERDMERIAKGAGIVEKFTPQRADHAFSIVGSSMA